MLPYGCGSCGSHPCLHFFRERKESSHFPQITHFHFPLVWAASHILKAQWRGEKNLHLMAAENPTPSSLQPIHLLFPLSWCPNPVHSASLGSDLPRLLSACFVGECLEQGAWLCDLALMFYQQSQWRACKLEVPMCPPVWTERYASVVRSVYKHVCSRRKRVSDECSQEEAGWK